MRGHLGPALVREVLGEHVLQLDDAGGAVDRLARHVEPRDQLLRVAHLRDSTYELQQHRRLARSRGVDADTQARIFAGPDSEGLTDRERVLITATDEFVVTRGVSPETWQALSAHLTKPQLIEFCLLAAQYDGLAATITTLQVPLDFPD